MTQTVCIRTEAEDTRACCRRALERIGGARGEPPLDIRGLTGTAEQAQGALSTFTPDDDAGRVRAVQRTMLHAALAALDRLDHVPVAPAVMARLCRVYRLFCDAPGPRDRRFRPDLEQHSRALAACAALLRFPAGQLDWEVSGIPRSYLFKVPVRDMPRVLRTVAANLHGVRPCFTVHMGVQRYPLLFVEQESHRAYYRIAQSMALQPAIKGLIAASWYHSTETIRVSAHLAWTNRTPLAHGAVVTDIGPASPDDGFLVGSAERRRLFEAGVYRPTVGLLIWPRRDLLAWADAHPEYGDEAATR